MKGWTGKHYVFFCGGIVLTYVVTRIVVLLCGTWGLHTLACLALVCLVPCMCSLGITLTLKRRRKGTGLCMVLPMVFDLLFLVLMTNITAATKLVSTFTGYNNTEATYFYLLFAVLFCSGLLAGALLGAFLPCRPKG